ncbi:MAG: alpha/beta hydrolase [Ruminococcus sp.]|nr:alpha/beta hydrolase [Ruminococcus sp.]MBR4622771.1 alpha/beta hydrolase [Ruminococcus sp.]
MTEFKESTFKSRDGEHDIYYCIWLPEGEPKGIVQIAHGMCEYVGRYDRFARFLNDNGYIVCGNDHLGHGSTAEPQDRGYFAPKDGFKTVVRDMHTLTTLMKKEYPGLPYFLFGHSMGSFLSRAYCTWFGSELDAAVFCGTNGIVKGSEALMVMIDAEKCIYGDRYRSRKLTDLVFGGYCKKIENPRTSSDWLTRDDDIVDIYIQDEKCGFLFTLNGFENLARMIWFISNEKWFSTLRKDLPVFLIAGDADPVGNYGEGVRDVYNKLISYCCNAKLKIYEGCRHELINEINKEEVYEDVLDFFNTYRN